MNALTPVLTGAAAMASLVVSLLFLRFWNRTRDVFFLLFACSFAIEAASRFILALATIQDEWEPYFYLPRLIAFGLIVAAVVWKNRPEKR